jgi:hypothetical protein
MRYIVTNFAYGYGPFLRTTDLALRINELARTKGKETMGIIVPWVYGERQKQIMRDEYGAESEHIYLDRDLGEILKKVFYADQSYEEALAAWVNSYESASSDAHAHLSGDLTVETLGGKSMTIPGQNIRLEVARAPRLSYNVAPAYGATFGHISEILKATLANGVDKIAANRDLVTRAIPLAEKLEGTQKMIGLAHPGTFSYRPERIPLPNEIRIPPTLPAPRLDQTPMAPGIYVTITGIPGLERLYSEAQQLGLTIYCNDPERLPGSIKATPDVIGNEAIKLHIARSGWGSVWNSQFAGKPVVVPPFDPHDDPEIYFNNLCVEKLGLGVVYKGEPLSELLQKAEALTPKIRHINSKILSEFGTFDGNSLLAEKIIADMH